MEFQKQHLESYVFYDEEIDIWHSLIDKLDGEKNRAGFKKTLIKEEIELINSIKDNYDSKQQARTSDINSNPSE